MLAKLANKCLICTLIGQNLAQRNWPKMGGICCRRSEIAPQSPHKLYRSFVFKNCRSLVPAASLAESPAAGMFSAFCSRPPPHAAGAFVSRMCCACFRGSRCRGLRWVCGGTMQVSPVCCGGQTTRRSWTTKPNRANTGVASFCDAAARPDRRQGRIMPRSPTTFKGDTWLFFAALGHVRCRTAAVSTTRNAYASMRRR